MSERLLPRTPDAPTELQRATRGITRTTTPHPDDVRDGAAQPLTDGARAVRDAVAALRPRDWRSEAPSAADDVRRALELRDAEEPSET